MRAAAVILFVMLAKLAPGADVLPAGKYSLSVARVFQSKASLPEWAFIVGGTGTVRGGETVCMSPAGLTALLKGLPRGSTVDWWPTCDGESRVLADHVEELKKTCSEAGIGFIIHPAG